MHSSATNASWFSSRSSRTPERIFADYVYLSSYADSWVRHARAYVDMMVPRLGLTPGSQVVEIASNDGYLLQFLVARGIPVLGIEPAANIAEIAVAKGIPTQARFFGTETAHALVADSRRADLIVANNVLAHVPALNDFVAGVRILLATQGVATLEMPHLLRLIEEQQFDTIYHEHFSYFSLLTLTRIFARHDLAIFDVEELPHPWRLAPDLCSPCQGDGDPTSPRVAGLLDREEAAGLATLDPYLAFARKVERTKRELLGFLIETKRQGKSIAGYGAPAKGNTLLNYCGIRSDFIDYVVDKNPYKQGRFLPGTHIAINHPDRIFQTRPDYLLLLPWNLRDEIIGQMAAARSWGCRFVTPIPEVRIYP